MGGNTLYGFTSKKNINLHIQSRWYLEYISLFFWTIFFVLGSKKSGDIRVSTKYYIMTRSRYSDGMWAERPGFDSDMVRLFSPRQYQKRL